MQHAAERLLAHHAAQLDERLLQRDDHARPGALARGRGRDKTKVTGLQHRRQLRLQLAVERIVGQGPRAADVLGRHHHQLRHRLDDPVLPQRRLDELVGRRPARWQTVHDQLQAALEPRVDAQLARSQGDDEPLDVGDERGGKHFVGARRGGRAKNSEAEGEHAQDAFYSALQLD